MLVIGLQCKKAQVKDLHSEPEIKEGIILASRLDSSYTNAVTLISPVDSL